MHSTPQPGDIIGYVSGRPVRLIGGGSEPAVEPPVVPAAPADPGVPPTFTVVSGQNQPTSTSTNTLQSTAPQVFTAEQIAKAREDEKNKLYPQLEELKKTVADLQKERDEKLDAERKAREKAEADAEEARKKDTDTRTLLEEQEQRFQTQLQQLQQEREEERRILALEQQYQELQAYRATAVAAAQNDIVPELLDLVAGTTREEIDASIDGLKQRSARIVEQMQAATQAARAGMRGVPVTAPPAGPMDTYSAHDPVMEAAANGSLSFEDYVKNRDKLLSSAARTGNGGLYG